MAGDAGLVAYVDSSVVLRIVLGQANALAEWRRITTAVVSSLVELECLRTLDRRRLARGFPDDELAVRREAVYRLIESFEVMEPTGAVLRRAAAPLPVPLTTLDAIHLATAALWRDERQTELTLATHDPALATAARATGFRTIG